MKEDKQSLPPQTPFPYNHKEDQGARARGKRKCWTLFWIKVCARQHHVTCQEAETEEV
jgi:hypothetical protein